MLVYESANPADGSSWENAFATRLPNKGVRRLAAMSLAWPGESGEVPNTDRPSYNALAVFWGDEQQRLQKLAAAIKALKGAANEHVGQNVAVFTKGSPESLQKATGNLTSPVEVHIGVVARAGTAVEPQGRLDYQYYGRKVDGEEDKSRVGQALRMSVGIGVGQDTQVLSVSRYGSSEVALSAFAPDEPQAIDVLRGAVTFSEGDGEYRRFRRLEEFPVILGNAAVNDFVRRLTVYDLGDARDNWRSVGPASDQPLPDLSQIFPLAA